MSELTCDRFPRSAGYDAAWVMEEPFGANPLWLTEWLCEQMPLQPGMRVLDLGCGRAKSSVFLASLRAISAINAIKHFSPSES